VLAAEKKIAKEGGVDKLLSLDRGSQLFNPGREQLLGEKGIKKSCDFSQRNLKGGQQTA